MTDILEPHRAESSAMASRTARPAVAAGLNLVVPGLGFQYAGFPSLAALTFLLYQPAEMATILLALVIPVRGANVAAPFGAMLVMRVGLAVATAVQTREAGARPVGRLRRWYALAASLALVSLVNAVWASGLKATVVEAYLLHAGSMEETILRGERVLVSKWDYGWRMPMLRRPVLGARGATRGDLVVFPFPEDPSRPFLKRVVGLPGETVEIRQQQVYIDGRPLEEPYARYIELPLQDSPEFTRRAFGPVIVPPASCFLLGDNRDNSRDSRYWGFVSESDLVGRARLVYWSTEPLTARVRWERIGLRLE